MKYSKLLIAVREVLFYEWDPIGINFEPLAINEYDSYASTICRFLREGADEHKIRNHLTNLQEKSIGVPVVNEEHNRKIAKKLLSLLE